MEKLPSENKYNIIDSHQHFWRYTLSTHGWINDEMKMIRRDFFPSDLLPELKANAVQSCVAVQADQTENETEFLLKLASENDFISGVVGWTDLRSDNAAEKLHAYSRITALKGFRHILQGEEPSFMMQPEFLKGISLLEPLDFTYDILVYPHHLPTVAGFVKQFPNQRFVIDHLAKPYIKTGAIEEWKKDLSIIARFPNVHCKLSGMVTEADPHNWHNKEFYPYIDAVVESFGLNRIMYGSDWPVCLTAATYRQVINIVKEYFSAFSNDEQALFFSENAKRFYRL